METGETILDIAEHSMEAIADAMVSMMSFITHESAAGIPGWRFQNDLDIIEEKYLGLQRQLNQTTRFIRMRWNSILQNDMLIDEAAEFFRQAVRFKKLASELDECIVQNEAKAFELMHGSWIAREYLVLMLEWHERNANLHNALLGLSMEMEQKQDPFYGIARKFRPYFVGVTDEQIKELVLNRRPLSDRPIWLGDRCEGTLMGQELGLEYADMNHSFLFRNRQGRPRDLKYSSDALNNDRRYYKISEVLDCVKEAKEIIRKGSY